MVVVVGIGDVPAVATIDFDLKTVALGPRVIDSIKVVDAEIIQYGDKEWSIKKPDASGEVMPVLVEHKKHRMLDLQLKIL